MPDIVIDGKVRVTWLTALASTTAPSAAALTAGVAIDAYLTPDGLDLTLDEDDVDVSALNSTFTAKAPGMGTFNGTLTLKDQGKAVAPWATLTGRPTGFLVVRRNLPTSTAYATGQFVEVYPCAAGDPAPLPPADNEVTKFKVQLFATSEPNLHAICAA